MWRRWRLLYPEEWRTLDRVVPYVRTTVTAFGCDRPKLSGEEKFEAWDEEWRLDEQHPYRGGHAHVGFDGGICIWTDTFTDPADEDDMAPDQVLRHELVHVLGGALGHRERYQAYAEALGYRPSLSELDCAEDDCTQDPVGYGGYDELALCPNHLEASSDH